MRVAESIADDLDVPSCDSRMKEQICTLVASGEYDSAVRAIRACRSQLMDEMHNLQSYIDRLDFVVYKIGKEKERKMIDG